jgi:hypothetical protein
MPAPLRVRLEASPVAIVYTPAPALKVMVLTSTSAESETSTMLEAPNVAISVAPFGTVAGVQLAAVFQSPVVGLRFQVALSAKVVVLARIKNKNTNKAL